MTPPPSQQSNDDRQSAISVCAMCGLPVKTVWSGDELLEVFSVCGHVMQPDAAEMTGEQA